MLRVKISSAFVGVRSVGLGEIYGTGKMIEAQLVIVVDNREVILCADVLYVLHVIRTLPALIVALGV